MSCFVIGDSIAVGVATFLPECRARAQAGITSTAWLNTLATQVTADLVVISLGANDWHLATYANLRTLRRGVTATRVVWLLPNIRRAGVRDAILRLAGEGGDATIDTAPYAGMDHLHPTPPGYRAIADLARGQYPRAAGVPLLAHAMVPALAGPR